MKKKIINPSIQETYALSSICYGCGPANEQGLKIKSYPHETNNEVICDWIPRKFHEAFPGVLNGGIIGTVLDCHSNWSAAYFIMKLNNEKNPPCTVTANYGIKLIKPTPSGKILHLVASPIDVKKNKAFIRSQLYADGEVCATCEGTFVAVNEGHPAYHRWEASGS